MLLVLSRCGDALLLSFGHPVRADFRVQVDIGFILIKHRMFRLLLSQRLLNGKAFFIIVRVFDFQRRRGSAPDNTRLFQVSVQGGGIKRHIKKAVDDERQQLGAPAGAKPAKILWRTLHQKRQDVQNICDRPVWRASGFEAF